MTIDYKKILKAYIRHVQDCEGTDFLYGNHGYPDLSSEDEMRVLMRVHRIVHMELGGRPEDA